MRGIIKTALVASALAMAGTASAAFTTATIDPNGAFPANATDFQSNTNDSDGITVLAPGKLQILIQDSLPPLTFTWTLSGAGAGVFTAPGTYFVDVVAGTLTGTLTGLLPVGATFEVDILATPVPIPGALALFASGAAVVGGVAARRKKQKEA